MRTLKLMLLSTVMMAGPAYAADLAPMPVEPIAPVYMPFSWTGFYVGAHAGYAFGPAKSAITVAPNSGIYDKDLDSLIVGLHAGYNYQFNQFVVGVEGDIDFVTGEESQASIPLGAVIKYETEWQGSLRLRAGYAIDRLLVYGTGGVAFNNGTATIIALGKDDQTHVGWTLGAGLEYAFTDNLIGRVEYRYTDFGREKYAISGVSAPFKYQQHAVTAGISYKF